MANSNPNFTDGQLVDASVWNSVFTGKVDETGGNLIGTFTGNPTWNGNHTFSGTGTALAVTNNATVGGTLGIIGGGGTALTVAPSALVWDDTSLPRMFNAHAAWTGSSSNTQPTLLNRFQVNDQISYSGSQYVAGYNFEDDYGGATSTGGKTAMNVTLVQSLGANGDSGADHFYTGLSVGAFGRYTPPGSSSTTPLGRIFGFNSVGQIQPGFTATNYFQVASAEFDVNIPSGSSSFIRSGVTIASLTAGGVQGSGVDNALWLYGAGAKWRYGINFSDTQAWPIDDTVGTMIGAKYGAGRNSSPDMSAMWGIDLQQVAFPHTGNPYDGGFLRSNGMSFDGAGTLQLGTTYFTSGSSGLTIDAKGSVGTGATIGTAGSGYESGNIVVAAFGGLWSVATSGGVPTGAVTTLVEPVVSSLSPPSNPITPTNLNPASQGSGLTLTLTWNTTGTTLALSPSGGPTSIGGTLGVTGALTVGSTFGVTSGNNLTINMGGNTKTLTVAGLGGTGNLAVFTANTTGNTVDFTGATLKSKFNNILPGTVTYSGAFSLTGSPLSLQFLPTGTPTAAGGNFPYANIVTTGDTAALGNGNSARLLNIGLQWGGAAMTGGRIGLVTSLTQIAQSGNGTNDAFYQGFQTSSDMSFNEGGTGLTSATARGHNFAGNSYSRIHNGATNLQANIGWEWDILAETGSSVLRQGAMTIVHLGTHAIQGTAEDYGIAFADASGSVPAKDLIQVGSFLSQDPLLTTGNIMRWSVPFNVSTAPPTAHNGIDLSVGVFTGSAFASRNFSVAGGGATNHFNASITQTGAGVAIDIPYKIGAVSSINNGGTGGTTGTWYRDNADIPGLWQVTAVSGVVTVATLIQAPYSVAGPATLTLSPLNTDVGGSTVVINTTWTAANTLALSPSGGTTTIGGAVQLGSGCFTANSTTSVSLTALAPAGAHATVQEWLTIKDAGGTVRYIPCF